VLGTLVVGCMLVMNLLRGWPLLSLVAAGAVAFVLFVFWGELVASRAEAEPVPVLASLEGVDAGQPVSAKHEVEQHQAICSDERPSGEYEQEELSQPGEASGR
jgi:hypothetical protein